MIESLHIILTLLLLMLVGNLRARLWRAEKRVENLNVVVSFWIAEGKRMAKEDPKL